MRERERTAEQFFAEIGSSDYGGWAVQPSISYRARKDCGVNSVWERRLENCGCESDDRSPGTSPNAPKLGALVSKGRRRPISSQTRRMNSLFLCFGVSSDPQWTGWFPPTLLRVICFSQCISFRNIWIDTSRNKFCKLSWVFLNSVRLTYKINYHIPLSPLWDFFSKRR